MSMTSEAGDELKKILERLQRKAAAWQSAEAVREHHQSEKERRYGLLRIFGAPTRGIDVMRKMKRTKPRIGLPSRSKELAVSVTSV